MASFYGSYVNSMYRCRIDVSVTNNSSTQSTVAVSVYVEMASYYHENGDNFLGRANPGNGYGSEVRGADTYLSGPTSLLITSKSYAVTRTHAAQSINVAGQVRNDWTSGYEGPSTASGSVTVPAKPSYTVTYNANGGSSTPGSQTKWYGESLTLASAISRSNASATGYKVTYNANGGSCSTASATAARTTKYTFSKWNTKSDGSGTAYSAGASYTGNAALTLYATWTSSTTTSAVTLPTPSRTGYAFAGWYNGSTKAGNAGASFTPTGNVTLTASWTQNSWTVTYAANGGSSTPASQTKLYGQTLTLRGAISHANATATYTVSYSANYSGGSNPSSGTATKTTKYAFSSWKATNGTTYAASGSYTANAATTMTAQWTSSASTTSVTLPTPTTRTGYTFGGWYKESACTNKVGNGGASYTPTASITLYAKWTINTWAVSYNANGGTGAPASQTKTYNQTLTLSSTRPARSGYTFLGWATKSDGTGAAYSPGGSYTANAAATLYAVWVAVQVTSLSAYRSDSSGTRSDSGTYGHLSAGWKAMGTIAGTVAVTATANDADVTSSLSNRSGSKTATADLSNTSTGTFGGSYAQDAAVRVSVTATLTVSYGGSSRSVSATRVATIPKVFRLLDALHGGTGLAIGTIATLASTLEVGLTSLLNGVVMVMQGNLTRAGQNTTATDGDHPVQFVDSAKLVMSYIDAHKTNSSPNNYLRLTAIGPSGSKTANVYISASDTNGYISTDCALANSLEQSSSGRGYFLKDSAGNSYPGVYDNGENLWLGSTKTASTHHKGQTYISAGHNGTSGNATIYVCVPNAANNGGTSYGVYHTGNKPSASDVGALPIGGGTLTGGLTLSAGGVTTTTAAHIIKDTRFDRDGANPSADVWSAVFGFQDKNGESLGYLQAYQLTGGATGLSLQVFAENSSGTQYNNLIRLAVDKSGNKAYSVGDAAAFRSAIGAQAAGSYATTNCVGAITKDTFARADRCFYIAGTVDNSTSVVNGKAVSLHLKTTGLSFYDASGTAYGWSMYGTRWLYANASGSNGTIELNETAANFCMMEIFFKGNDGTYDSASVYSPNGKVVSLSMLESTANGGNNKKWRSVTISAKSITTKNYSEQDNAGTPTATNHIYICYVLGYYAQK